MTKMKHLLFLSAIAFAVISCSKKPPVIPPVTSEKQIEIKFDDNTISINNVDSVIVKFKLPGSQNYITKKLSASGNSFVTKANDLSPATYSAEFEVYERKQPGVNYSYVYRSSHPVTLPLQTADITLAPTGKLAGNWAPNFLFRNEEKNVTLILAERPDDPYFELRAPQLSSFKYAGMDKAFFGGGNTAVYLIDDHFWVSQNNPFVNSPVYSNTTAFANIAQFMQGKEWYRTEISFFLEENNGGIYFDHIYYKRP